MAENKLWSPVQTMFTLLSCAVPYSLKAEVLLTLASFAKSPEIASSMWNILELSQVSAYHCVNILESIVVLLYSAVGVQYYSFRCPSRRYV